MPADLIYAYGLVRAREALDAAKLPSGLDDGRVTLEPAPDGTFSALVSRLEGTAYAPGAIERSIGDMAWLSPRAMAHDRVLTWAQEHGGVIPLPMFTLFGSDAALADALSQRAATVGAVFDRVRDADEFGVRAYRRDEQMLAAIDRIDPKIAELRAAANAAAPGQRYLLERKITDQSKAAIRVAAQRLAHEIFERLRELARDALARQLVPDPDRAADATLVLNGAFLVDRTRVDAFRAAMASVVREHEPIGLTFDFTGPWPPYHFVGAPDDGAQR